MIETALILDTETTGTSPDNDHVIEVGVVIFSLVHATPVECQSWLVRADGNPAEHVNGIPSAVLADVANGHAYRRETSWSRLETFVRSCDVIVAHNAAFDASFIPSSLRLLRPWVCTMSDFTWPATSSGRSLLALAAAHRVPIGVAHRAPDDALLIARLLEHVASIGGDLQTMFAQAMRPKVKVLAVVSYDDREKAKTAGFAWDSGARRWWMMMPAADVSTLPFPAEVAA